MKSFSIYTDLFLPGQQQKPLEQWAVDLRRAVENREAENLIPGSEDLPEIRNPHDQPGPREKNNHLLLSADENKIIHMSKKSSTQHCFIKIM